MLLYAAMEHIHIQRAEVLVHGIKVYAIGIIQFMKHIENFRRMFLGFICIDNHLRK